MGSEAGMCQSLFAGHLQQLMWLYCLGHAEVKANTPADRLVGKATITNGSCFGRVYVVKIMTACVIWYSSEENI